MISQLLMGDPSIGSKKLDFLRTAFLNAAWIVLTADVVGLILRDRAFAYLLLISRPFPLYSLDASLLIILSLLFMSGYLRFPRSLNKYALATLGLAFGLSLARGIIIYSFADAMRDAMIFGYGLYAIIVVSCYQARHQLKLGLVRATIGLLLAAILIRIVLLLCGFYFRHRIALQPAASGLYFSGAVIAIHIFTEHSPSQYYRWLARLLIAMIVLISVRSAWVGLAATIAVAIFVNRSTPVFPAMGLFLRRTCLIGAVMGIAISLMRPRDFFIPIMKDLRGLILPTPQLGGETYGTIRTRFWMWEDAYHQVADRDTNVYTSTKLNVITNRELLTRANLDPLRVTLFAQPVPSSGAYNSIITQQSWAPKQPKLGQLPTVRDRVVYYSALWPTRLFFGFPMGRPFVPLQVSRWLDIKRFDPHNSLVAIFFRTGLVGVLSFLILFFSLLYHALLNISSAKEGIQKNILRFGLLFAFYGFVHLQTDVVLESPFKAVFFWLAVGLCLIEPPANEADGS
jgi:hypothetical protein